MQVVVGWSLLENKTDPHGDHAYSLGVVAACGDSNMRSGGPYAFDQALLLRYRPAFGAKPTPFAPVVMILAVAIATRERE